MLMVSDTNALNVSKKIKQVFFLSNACYIEVIFDDFKNALLKKIF